MKKGTRMRVGCIIEVQAILDEDTGVWFAECKQVPGLNVEAATPHELLAIIEDVLPQLIVSNAAHLLKPVDHIPPNLSIAFLAPLQPQRACA